ncbi:phosphatidylinositol 4,5-bisphosphate-binding protein [Diatrype stigma]|uniref:Phosphatidylinositol 4,5-bisphosphate-binding protein n=1 Tax=Diatrype stigma TaxID=117547 RepID=A0AAN9V3N3_9PEZI
MQRSNSVASHRSEVIPSDSASTHQISLSRGNTLKKKQSLRRSGSLKRSSSRRSMRAGSVRSLALQSSSETDEQHSVFYCPVPTSGNPTDTLASRFQAWRKLLKDLIACFREIQSHYEHRSKSLLKLANVLNNTSTPPGFLASGGLDDALQIMRNHHKSAIIEANKAREIEEDVILALTGLRSDLNQKTKEIKSLSGDFKNAVEKEMDGTRKAVNALQEVLGHNEVDSAMTTGKQDPYLLRLAVDRQVERQLDEENYLHKAYLNLETSGRELEAIVVGEIQKSYNAYAGILKREADAAYNAVDELRAGPISMPKDYEWISFIQRDSQFVDPEVPMRSPEQIHYPGRDHYACQEIRAGLLERKSKYLKSYTAGWYVLSPTHLHEFKSADKTQAPVMSLYLPEQKLGSHSTEGGSSNKFILKGRQTGAMHRGHSWVFRAESHDTMMAWYEDIKALTEKSPEELSHFVRDHSRSFSRSSQRSLSSDGNLDADEDEEPFTPDAAAIASTGPRQYDPNRPEPGGRFPSDLEVTAQRGLQVPLSPSSASSGILDYNEYAKRGANNPRNMNPNGVSVTPDQNIIAAAVAQPGSGLGNNLFMAENNQAAQSGQRNAYGDTQSVSMNQAPSHAAIIDHEARQDGVNPYNGQPVAYPQTLPQRSNSKRFSYTSDSEALDTTPSSPMHPSNYAPNSMNVLNGGLPESQQQKYTPAPVEGGFTKPLPAAAGGLPYTRTQDGQIRPRGGPRTDSNPHVPGEYPRSSIGTTPNI